MSRSVSAAFKQAPAVSARELLVEERLMPALRHLLRAYDYAQDVGRDRWEFAVELSELRRLGLNHADCRWLMCKNLVELARELAPRTDGVRQFRRLLGLSLGKRTCVVLSLGGASVARSLIRQQNETPPKNRTASYPTGTDSGASCAWARSWSSATDCLRPTSKPS
jgi:hypothetical protein